MGRTMNPQPNPGSIITRVEQLTPGIPYFFTIIPRNLNGDGYRLCPTSAANLVQTVKTLAPHFRPTEVTTLMLYYY